MDSQYMKTAIVTGANGFIGSHLVKKLLNENVEVIAVDLEGNNKNVDPRAVFIGCDLTNADSLLHLIANKNVDVFYHFAWIGSAGEKRFDSDLQLNNAKWTIDALTVAHNLGCKKFICAGSIMEEESYIAAFTQGNKPGLGYIYGSGKLVAHTMCMSVAANLGIDLCWAMITNAYGAGELSPRFINTTLRKIINNDELKFTAATQNYDFVYIDDIAKAFYLIGEKGHPFKRYLIGSGRAQPLKNFILEIKEKLAPDRVFIFGDVPFTGINLDLSVFSNDELVKDTGFECDYSFKDGIEKTYEFLKEVSNHD